METIRLVQLVRRLDELVGERKFMEREIVAIIPNITWALKIPVDFLTIAEKAL